MLQSHFVSLEEAEARLRELFEQMLPGETLHLTQDNHTVAKLVKQPPPLTEPRQPGSAQGKILYMADDFDAPLEAFKEYTP